MAHVESSAGGRSKSAHLAEKLRKIMINAQPIFDSTTHYRIELQGYIDVEWLQRFDDSVLIAIDETGPVEAITVLNVHADQAGIVGLVRKLHGLGITILRFQIVSYHHAEGE